MTDDFADSMMEIFVFETNGFLEQIEKILMDNENNTDGIKSAVGEIFRIMHTIKSSSAMMSLDNVSKMAHTVEDLFFYIRENKPEHVDYARLTDLVLDCVDYIKRNMNGSIDEDPQEKTAEVLRFLDNIKETPCMAGTSAEKAAMPAAETDVENTPAQCAGLCFRVVFKETCQMLGLRALEIQKKIARICTFCEFLPQDTSSGEQRIRTDGMYVRAASDLSDEELLASIDKSPFVDRVVEAVSFPDETAEPAAAAFIDMPRETDTEPAPAGRTVACDRRAITRPEQMSAGFASVAVSKLDELVDMVGEVLIAGMNLDSSLVIGEAERIEKNQKTLKTLILRMQELALSTRMVTLEDTFHKMHRTVRDISRKQNKGVTFVTSGEKTEVDRNVIDHISSPLIHIIRNSVDHGLESTEQREACGKSPEGRIELSARAEGSNILISVSDDGRGLDRRQILEKAVSKGLVDRETSDALSDDDVFSFIFMPGFSTSESVTEFSGRGVGMDVVNASISKLQGKVSVKSKPGRGTTVSMSIPLSMAILDALILRVGDDICAVPLGLVTEMFAVDSAESVTAVNGSDVVLFRDKCYRIIDMVSFFEAKERIPYTEGVMLVIRSDTYNCVLFVDEVLQRQSIVVKPIPSLFKSVRGISGCTILAEGKIGLILDVAELLTL